MDFLSINIISAYLTLTIMEVILGIDNIVFISIAVAKVKNPQLKQRLRELGLCLALVLRLVLLFSITWVISLKEPLISILTFEITGKDIILIGGGLFLLIKGTYEIHDTVALEDHPDQLKIQVDQPLWIIAQIGLMDLIFSLDSIITAVGMSRNLYVMSSAIITSIIVMLLCAKSIGNFIDKNPSIKILALSFLILIVVMLIAEGFEAKIDKAYIYFAIAFSLCVESINLKYKSNLKRKNGN